jgi:hypothetical protein
MQTFEIKNRWNSQALFSAGGETLRDRILSACVQSPTGCMEWKLHTVRGSGRMKVNGRKQYVHRLMWEIVNGAIPEGLFVLHHCDNPACVEPSHLFVGTHADNMADMVAKGRSTRGRQLSDSHRINVSEAGRGRRHSPETRRRISDSLRRRSIAAVAEAA